MSVGIVQDVAAAGFLLHHAISLLAQGQHITQACAMAKCCAADVTVRRPADARQIFGGSGYIRRFRVERLYRNAKMTSPREGKNRKQGMSMAHPLLHHGAC